MPHNELQKLSPAYRLPASDPDFLLSDSMQGVRFLLEFAKADERLRSWGVRSTIVVLGRARIREANGDGATAAAGQTPRIIASIGRSRPFFYSITSSAWASTLAGISRPSALAVLT